MQEVKTYAVILGTSVTNVVEALSPVQNNWVDITNINPKPGIGWNYSGGVFTAPVVPPVTTPELPAPVTSTAIMTHNAFTSRLDFFTEFTPIHTARKTDDQIDAAFTLFYGAKDVDVRDPMTQALIGLLVQKGLLQASRMAALLAEIPITTRGAIHPVTGEITK